VKKLLIIFFLFITCNSFATHYQAGEITYEYIGTAITPYKYKITITTYAEWYLVPSSTDYCEVKVFFGDGDSAIAPRTNGSVTSPCAPYAEGEMIPGTNTRKSVY